MKLVQNISNTCRSIVGIKPTIYWAFRDDCKVTIVDNTVTVVPVLPLGVLSGYKSFANAGHEAVVDEQNCTGYKHKLSAIVNSATEVVDAMDDVLFFVTTNDGKNLCFGAKYGMTKESQSQMFNDNLSNVAVEFGSRAGIEEPYEAYTVTADLSLIPKMTDFYLIYGGTIANGGAVKLTIDADKTGYIKLPNGTILTTVAGVIDTIYSGVGGAITYYVPKGTGANIMDSNINGDLTTNVKVLIGASETTLVSSLTATVSTYVYMYGYPILSSIIAPLATTAIAQNCALTAKSIGDIIYQAYIDNRQNVNFDFSGGTNALEGAVDTYLQSAYGVTYATVYSLLVTTNLGTILIDVA